MDGKVDSLDAKLIEQGVKNNALDVNLDGSVNQADADMIYKLLDGTISYLPADLEKLPNRAERISAIQKINKLYGIYKKSGELDSRGWICRDFSLQDQIMNFGISNIGEFIQNYKVSNGEDFFVDENASSGFPVYYVSILDSLGNNHSLSGMLVGGEDGSYTPVELDDWYFWSNYSGKQVVPGSKEMSANWPVSIGLEVYVENPLSHEYKFSFLPGIVSFNLKDGKATLDMNNTWWKNLTLSNPNIIKVHAGSLENTVLNYEKDLDVSPDALGKPDVTTENTELVPVYSYKDSEKRPLSSEHPEIEYEFDRTHYFTISSGGVVKKDSSENKITVKDIEPPPITAPCDTSITNEDELLPAFTGYPLIGEDNSGLPVDTVFSYQFISDDSSGKIIKQFGRQPISSGMIQLLRRK